MDELNNLRFDMRRYEENLSVFGKKVLKVLVQKWKADKDKSQKYRNSYYQHGSVQNTNYRKKDTFIQTQFPIPPPMFCDKINNDDESEPGETCFDLNFPEPNPSPNVGTSFELVQTVTTSNEAACPDDASISSDDLINPVIEGRIPTYPYKVLPNDYSNFYQNNNDTEHHSNDVDWNNMFDTELFSTTQVAPDQIIPPVPNTFNIKPREKVEAAGTNVRDKTKYPDKQNNNKKSKRNNQPITDAIPKKVKKVFSEPKINTRKKSVKAVKHWLDDIDSNNPVEREDYLGQNKTALQIAEVVIEEVKGQSNKKVVQAQLANKDGIMKFRKPTSKIINNPEHVKGSTPEENHTADHETLIKKKEEGKSAKKDTIQMTKEKTINKDKKTKTQFVAPIMSQIPIKDMEFLIAIMDGQNIDYNIEKYKFTENQDLVLVLTYRNGYCQLNNHHTDDITYPEGFMLSIDSDFFYFKDNHQNIKDILQPLLQNNKIVCYGGKSLLMYLKSKLDLDIFKMSMIDTEIGGSVMDPDNPPENFSELQKLISFTPQFTIATDCVLQKTAWYATLLKECAHKLCSLLIEEQLWNVFMDIEMKLLPIIADMESRGVSIDVQKLKSMEDLLLAKMKVTELECHKAAGRTFQINSPVQVRALIYDELKLDAKCNIKIRETLAQGAKSTSESMLRGLVPVHPLPRLILEYRHLHKAYSTFLAGITQHVRDGKVRPTWVQTAAATGRIASSNPNLQAIPKVPFNLVLFPEISDCHNTGQEALNFRSVYTSREGYKLLACDFKHVECRVFAHHAADAALLACLRGQGDLFRLLAHKWLKKPESEVSSEDRERTKRIVYASLYGAGVRKLMELLGVGYEQALAVQTSFNRTFPSLKSFGESVVCRCSAAGGRLATLCGRARRFNNISSREFALRAQAERQAVNFIIQGSAADLCKLAMVEACARLRSHCPPLDGHLLLQIHDELVWEVNDQHLDAAAVVIKRAMEECGLQSGMDDPLPVAVSVGRSWGEMQLYRANV